MYLKTKQKRNMSLSGNLKHRHLWEKHLFKVQFYDYVFYCLTSVPQFLTVNKVRFMS